MDPKWYLQRLASMGPTEIANRVGDEARRRLWRTRPPALPTPITTPPPGPVVPADLTSGVAPAARRALLAEADGLLAGRWTMFGRPRTDMTADIDWFLDFVSGVRAPDRAYSLTIPHRDEAAVGNIKFVWEPARHQHLSMLAAASAVSGDDRYADRVAAELRNYWAANPFLVGVHWTSGIELGLRLISWTWIRRLLDGWSGAAGLFEHDPTFAEQLGRHHQWITGLGSHGSSANNHVIAEAAGQFVAASAFPLFADSTEWRDRAAEQLARELAAQTFPDGLNRELASEYHGFVLELGLAAWVEAVLTGHPVAGELAGPLARAVDALDAVVDARGRPHRQGDSDDAHGWLVDPVGYDRWTSLRRTGALLVEPAPWWPPTDGAPDVRTALIRACVADRHHPVRVGGRPPTRPALFPDAGLSLLRTEPSAGPGEPELWCAFDHGPLGYLSTAAHGHADALAVEIRCDGVEVVADPGTYCYHGEPRWRDHFRSTRAHATVTLGERSQSDMAGPFLWSRKAEATLEASEGLDGGDTAMSRAHHDGYAPQGWIHRREVRLDRPARVITVVDALEPGRGIDRSDHGRGRLPPRTRGGGRARRRAGRSGRGGPPAVAGPGRRGRRGLGSGHCYPGPRSLVERGPGVRVAARWLVLQPLRIEGTGGPARRAGVGGRTRRYLHHAAPIPARTPLGQLDRGGSLVRISVLGLGYVGAVSAACLADAGHTVIGVDPNETKVDLINGGQSPIVEAGVAELVAAHVANGRITATTDPAEAVAASDLAIVCVGTPGRDNGSLDLTYLERACANLGDALADRDRFFGVVIRSTVLPGTCRDLVIPTIEGRSGKRHGVEFGVVMNPEFLREGSAVDDFHHPPKVVVGGEDGRTVEMLLTLHPAGDHPVIRTGFEVAEMVKYVDNTWHALKVAFGNEIGRICEPLGIDSHQVMDVFCLDTKLNLSDKYLRPGMAFGGSCLPKDVRAMTYHARSNDVDLPLLSNLTASNETHLERAVKLVLDTGRRDIAILGLSFKAGTDDLREAPMVELAERLLGKGLRLTIYDRNVSLARLTGANAEFIHDRLPHIGELLVDDVDRAIDGAEVVVVGNGDPRFADVIDRIPDDVDIIDLVRVVPDGSSRPNYRGLGW